MVNNLNNLKNLDKWKTKWRIEMFVGVIFSVICILCSGFVYATKEGMLFIAIGFMIFAYICLKDTTRISSLTFEQYRNENWGVYDNPDNN